MGVEGRTPFWQIQRPVVLMTRRPDDEVGAVTALWMHWNRRDRRLHGDRVPLQEGPRLLRCRPKKAVTRAPPTAPEAKPAHRWPRPSCAEEQTAVRHLALTRQHSLPELRSCQPSLRRSRWMRHHVPRDQGDCSHHRLVHEPEARCGTLRFRDHPTQHRSVRRARSSQQPQAPNRNA